MTLSIRFCNDGKPSLSLNELQLKMRDSINSKIDSKLYGFESADCSVCGKSETDILSEKDRYGLAFTVAICRSCGLIFTSPRMNQESYAAFYDCEYRSLYHGKECPVEDLFRKGTTRAKEIAEFVTSQGVQLQGKRVLEVGCGSGGLLAYFRDKFNCDTRGCDFGSEGVQYGCDHYGLNLVVGDITSVSPDWKPDLIIYSHVFEHILDLNRECQSIHETLADDGLVYIEVPGVKNIEAAYKADFLLLLQNAHTYHFTLDTLNNITQQNGFRLKAGNEFVRSLFEKGLPESASNNDYEPVMKLLNRLEKARIRRALRRYSLRRYSPARLTRSILRKLGLRGIKRV